jgi:hypothetical protein
MFIEIKCFIIFGQFLSINHFFIFGQFLSINHFFIFSANFYKSNISSLFSSQWIIQNSPIGGSCAGNTGPIEKCNQTVIPNCVDRNNYCSLPPDIPTDARRDDVHRPLQDWINVPDTKLIYYCAKTNWAFNYKTDSNAPSYYFTNNINNMTITCNKNG